MYADAYVSRRLPLRYRNFRSVHTGLIYGIKRHGPTLFHDTPIYSGGTFMSPQWIRTQPDTTAKSRRLCALNRTQQKNQASIRQVLVDGLKGRVSNRQLAYSRPNELCLSKARHMQPSYGTSAIIFSKIFWWHVTMRATGSLSPGGRSKANIIWSLSKNHWYYRFS